MTVKEYIDSCLQFAQDTRKWSDYSHYSFYSTRQFGGWYESRDNSGGGFDVSWAFHLPAKQIRAEGAQRFVDEIASLVRCLADNCEDDRDAEMIYNALEDFEHLKK